MKFRPVTVVRYCALAAVLFAAAFALYTTVTTHAASTYFSDDFESGNLSKWTGWNGDSNGLTTVESSVVNQGSHAAQFTNVLGQYSYVTTPLPGGPRAETYSRFYFRVAQVSSTLLMMTYHDGNSSTWEAIYNEFFHGIEIYFWSGSNQVYGISTGHDAIDINKWYCVEVYMKQATDGHAQVWLDGQSIGTVNADLSTTHPLSRLFLYNDNVQTVYYDDVAVSDSYIGPVNTTPTPAATLTPGSVNFGNQNVSTTATRTVSVKNTGTASLTVNNVSISGANAGDFSQTNDCSSALAPNSSCTVTVSFTPGALGARSATLNVTSNAADSPHTVALSGTGVTPAPIVTLTPTSLSFTDQQVGSTSQPRTATLTNSGTSTLNISSVSVTGTNASDFAQTNDCGSTLAAGASCTLNVTFTPSAAGSSTASVSIASDAAGSPHTVSLTGNGVTSLSYYNDDFETGNFSKWSFNNSDSSGQVTVQSTTVHSGTHAASLKNTTSSQYGYIYTALPTVPSGETFTRFYFNIHDLTLGTDLAIARNDYGGNAWELAYNPNSKAIDIYFWGAGNQVYILSTPTNSIQADTWYSLEVSDLQAVSGHGQVWLNGTSVGQINQDLSAAHPYSRLMFFNSSPGTVYIDDVDVASTYRGTLP